MWHDIKQNTDEWLDLRAGKVTGSSIGKVMANFGKAFGRPAKDLAVSIAVELVTGNRQENNYTNSHMDRGHQEEPIARLLYEEEFFVDVTNGGFYDNITTGSSPDGRVLDCGLIEIKSAIPSIHYERIRKESYDSAYKWQLIFNLKESGRDWIDFVSFCSFFPEDKKLYVKRLSREDLQKEYDQIDERLGEFFSLVNEVRARITCEPTSNNQQDRK